MVFCAAKEGIVGVESSKSIKPGADHEDAQVYCLS